MTALDQGAPAPDFDLATDTGERFKLSDHAGSRVLLYFYPKADTPGCTNENIDFTTLSGDFSAKGIKLVGISPDTPDALAAFRKKYDLSPVLVSDPDKEAIAAYAAWGEKQNYGRTVTGLIRSTVLVDADQTIARVWSNVRAKGHAERVLRDIA